MKVHHQAIWIAIAVAVLIFLAVVFLPRVMHGGAGMGCCPIK